MIIGQHFPKYAPFDKSSGGTGPAANNPLPALPAWLIQASETGAKVAREFTTDEGIPFGYTLSDMDLMLVATNAFCITSNNSCPPVPTQFAQSPPNPPGIYLIARDIDRITFEHCITAMGRHTDARQRAAVQPVQQAGVTGMAVSDFHAYIDTLNAATKAVINNPAKYRDRLIEVVACYTAVFGSLGAFDPMYQISHAENSQVTYLLGQQDARAPIDTCTLSISAGHSIFIPGCGYNTLLNFDKLVAASEKYPIILNDRSEYVCGIVRRLAELKGVNSIQVIEGDFGDVQLPEDSVGHMVISLLSEADGTSFAKLAANAHKFLARDGKVVGFEGVDAGPDNRLSVEEELALFLDRDKFSVGQRKEYDYPGLVPQTRDESIRRLDLPAQAFLAQQFSNQRVSRTGTMFVLNPS